MSIAPPSHMRVIEIPEPGGPQQLVLGQRAVPAPQAR